METRLTDNYANAYSDFYPSRAPCIFKSGPDWKVRTGPQAQGIEREACPVHHHKIGPTWIAIGTTIYELLNSTGVEWTSIHPLAYANAGEVKPFCPLIISIGVRPHSLLYKAAVAAATAVKEILANAGFPDIEVAFIESVVTPSIATGPKLLSFNPLVDDVPNLRKPFTTALGVSIAPHKHPDCEGTAALYFRLSNNDDRIAMLTCAHVARPLSVFGNTSMTRTNNSQAREEIVVLGDSSFNEAIEAMTTTIGNNRHSIDVWNGVLARLGPFIQGEVTERRRQHQNWVENATREIQEVNMLHSEVTEHRTTLDQRIIGFVLHSEKIETVVEPHSYTRDWALIEVYNEMIDTSTFVGNKVYIGTSFFHLVIFLSSVLADYYFSFLCRW